MQGTRFNERKTKVSKKLPPLARRFVNSEQAVKTKTQHRKPCADCPFARKAIPGWLGARTPEGFLREAHGEAYLDCHCTTNQQCAGAAIFRANVCKSCRTDIHLVLEQDTTLVFANNKEFLQHHNRL